MLKENLLRTIFAPLKKKQETFFEISKMPDKVDDTGSTQNNSCFDMIFKNGFIKRNIQFIIDFYGREQSQQSRYKKSNQ